MKNKLLNILLVVAIVFAITGCDFKNVDNKNQSSTEVDEITITDYYNDDESINLFINKYNRLFDPDITSDMISKKRIGGSDRDDVVTISNDKLEINIYGSSKYSDEYKMEVYIGYRAKIESSNDDFKKEFVKYIKMFDESLSDSEIEGYWNDMISEYRSSYKINEIEIRPYISNGKVSYFKIESKIKLK